MSIPAEGIALKVVETAGITRRKYPLTRGVPLPQGAVVEVENLSLQDGQAEMSQCSYGSWAAGRTRARSGSC